MNPMRDGSITHFRDRQSRSSVSSAVADAAKPKSRLSASSIRLFLLHRPVEYRGDEPGFLDPARTGGGAALRRKCDEHQRVLDDQRIFAWLVLPGQDVAERDRIRGLGP